MLVFSLITLLQFIDASNVPKSKNLSCIRYKDMIPTYACNYQINSHANYCEDSTFYKSNTTCLCNNINWLGSVLGCLSYEGKVELKSIQGVKKFCQINGGINLTQKNVEFAFQKYLESTANLSVPASNNTNPTIDHPIFLSSQEVDLYRRAYEKYLGNFDNSIYYGTVIYGYWMVVVLLAAVANWIKYIFPNLSSLNSAGIKLIQKHVLLPALRGKLKAQLKSWGPVEFMIPSRIETLILGVFLLLLTIMTFLNTDPVEGDPIFYTRNNAQLRYIVDRSGIISTMLAPLVVLFAGRNNILLWITRWQYVRFLVFHRWIARTMVIMAATHAIGYTKLLGSFYYKEIKTGYLRAGVVAIVAGTIMLAQGALYMRRRWYETFLVVHIVLGVCWLVGCWTHVNELGFVYFFYLIAIIWGLDRVVRVVRLYFFGFPFADVELVTDNLIKIDIPLPKSWQKRNVLGHAFIHIFRPSWFWQSHPFTFMHSITNKKHMVCYCKVKEGFTFSLCRYLASKPNHHAKLRVGVEGPYGATMPVAKTDSMVFIASGSGIPGIYQEVSHCVKEVSRDSSQRVKLVWIIRNYSSIRWFHAELKAFQKTPVQVTVYVTGHFVKPKETGDIQRGVVEEKEIGCNLVPSSYTLDTTSLDSVDESITSDLSFVGFLHGRPDVTSLVANNIEECATSVTFITCGHTKLVDDIRAAVCQKIDNATGKAIHFYDQSQVWA